VELLAPEPEDLPAQWSSTAVLDKSKAAWRQHSFEADENFQAFSGPLVDQNGKWVRYQALVNRREFDYIVDNKLYNLDGQVEFSHREEGNEVSMPVNEGTSRHGAIEIKLSWKELGPNDEASRFLTKRLEISTSQSPSSPLPPTRMITAGLVGMHISMRTQSSPEWIWATFEQVDNVRQNKMANGKLSHANFTNPSLVSPPVNQLPARNGGCDENGQNCTTWYEDRTQAPVQVARVVLPTQPNLNEDDARLATGTEALNTQVQAILGSQSSVLQYYELVGAQWPVHPRAAAFVGGANSAPGSIQHKVPGDILPVFLVNTTMETYFQKGAQPAGPLEQDDRLADGAPPIDATPVIGTESCVGCHYSAGIAVGFKKGPDGKDQRDSMGQRTPIFGENGNFGNTGNANFSWMLQLEAHAIGEAKPAAERRKSATGLAPNLQP
jgi:hypothetical protein